jgi:inward rectifier potassium channel
MALLETINLRAKADKNTGFGTNASSYGGRFVNKNGSANVKARDAYFAAHQLVP